MLFKIVSSIKKNAFLYVLNFYVTLYLLAAFCQIYCNW